MLDKKLIHIVHFLTPDIDLCTCSHRFTCAHSSHKNFTTTIHTYSTLHKILCILGVASEIRALKNASTRIRNTMNRLNEQIFCPYCMRLCDFRGNLRNGSTTLSLRSARIRVVSGRKRVLEHARRGESWGLPYPLRIHRGLKS